MELVTRHEIPCKIYFTVPIQHHLASLLNLNHLLSISENI